MFAGVGGRTTALGYTADSIRQKFTGYERDVETGLDFAQARYCSPSQGRFTSPDPLMTSANTANPQTLNRYGYVANNPLKFVDPSGMIMGKRKDGEVGDISVLEGTQYSRGTMYDYNEADVAEAEAKQEAWKRQQQQKKAEEECGCTLRIRGKAGAKLSKGNPLRFPYTKKQTLGPVSSSVYWGWQVEISGSVPDDVSQWTIRQEIEGTETVTEVINGEVVTTTSPVSRAENLSSSGYRWTSQTPGAHRFFSLDAPGIDKSTFYSLELISKSKVLNFTTYLEKGSSSRKITWSLRITVTNGKLTGNFLPHHIPLR